MNDAPSPRDDKDESGHPRARRVPHRRRPPNHVVIEALRAQAGLIAPAAAMLQVHRQRLHEWIADDAELRAARDVIREEILDLAEGKLLQAVKEGSERSIHFLLKTIGKNRGFSERTEVVGGGGGTINVMISADDAKL